MVAVSAHGGELLRLPGVTAPKVHPSAEVQARPLWTALDALEPSSALRPVVAVSAKSPGFRVSQPLKLGVIAYSSQGGSGNVARVCGAALAEAGHETSLLTNEGGFWDSQIPASMTLESVDVPHSPLEPAESWVEPLARQLVELAQRKHLDGIMVHYAAGLLDAALRARDVLAAANQPMSVSATLHGTDISTWAHHPVHGPALRTQLERCDAVSAVSEGLADQAQSVLRLTQRPRVILNSVDTGTFNADHWRVTPAQRGQVEDVRRRLAPYGETLIAHASNLRQVKRPLDAVETFAKIHAQRPSKLLLLGDGPMIDAVYQRAMELGVADDIIPMGAQDPDRMSLYLAASDLSLVTSEAESFCLAALESLAVGTPVIGTHCGGLDEIMVGFGEGMTSNLLSEVGDTRGMAAHALALLADRAAYDAVRGAGERLPLERFPRSAQERGYLDLAELIRPPGTGAAAP